MNLPPLKWKPSPNHSVRSTKISLLVFHDLEGTYQGGIGTFMLAPPKTRNPVSAHIVLRKDGMEATQVVAYADKAWACVDFNSPSINIEMEGYEKNGYPEAELEAAAKIGAYLCHRFSIPPIWSNNGTAPGVCQHRDLGRRGGGHTDFTLDPKVLSGFIARIGVLYAAGNFPEQPWGR